MIILEEINKDFLTHTCMYIYVCVCVCIYIYMTLFYTQFSLVITLFVEAKNETNLVRIRIILFIHFKLVD